MAQPLTIHGELRVPDRFFQGASSMDEIERRLRAYGLLPVQAQAQRWRMDAESPGGYILTYIFALPLAGEEGVS